MCRCYQDVTSAQPHILVERQNCRCLMYYRHQPQVLFGFSYFIMFNFFLRHELHFWKRFIQPSSLCKSNCLLLGCQDLWVKGQISYSLGVGQCRVCRGEMHFSIQTQVMGREFSLLCDRNPECG